MKSSEFCYWLQGFFEVANPETINATQLCMIKKHLALVFVHELDKTHGDEVEQEKLNKIHGPPKPFPPGSSGPDMLYRC